MDKNHDLLQKCRKEIEHSLNWIDSNQWQHKHFESLSDLVFDKTKVCLSPLTLKRIWGKVKYDSKPSASTLDALARFLDYNSWIEYQSINRQKPLKQRRSGYVLNKKILITTSIVIGITLLIFGALKMIPSFDTKDYSEFEFSFESLSSGIPNTVYFKYNVKNTDADSVIIQQSWDPKLHHLVDKEKTDFSCIYYYPGYYNAKLVLDNNVVAQQDLLVGSNGWLGIMHKEPIPTYLPLAQIYESNSLSIKEAHLVEAGFDLKNQIPMTTINIVKEFDGLFGDNFELSAHFEQTYAKGEAVCQHSGVFVMCTNDYFYIPFSIKGCVNELQMHIPGKTLNAWEEDLRYLGIENNQGISLRLKVTDGVLNLNINNHQSFMDTLTVNPGRVVGVQIAFHGPGQVYSFNIQSETNSYSMTDFMP